MNGAMVRFYDETSVHFIGVKNVPQSALGWKEFAYHQANNFEYIEGRAHGVGVCPIVRFEDRNLLEVAEALRARGIRIVASPVVRLDVEQDRLAGILTAGSRIPAVPGSRILFVDGVAVAALIAGKCACLDGSGDVVSGEWQRALMMRNRDRTDCVSA